MFTVQEVEGQKLVWSIVLLQNNEHNFGAGRERMAIEFHDHLGVGTFVVNVPTMQNPIILSKSMTHSCEPTCCVSLPCETPRMSKIAV